jgi:hypothetical protein
MKHSARSIRPFIGAENFDPSRRFYRDLGFEEVALFKDMSLLKTGNLGFYLQDAYVKDWVDNSMIFLEVDDVERYWNELQALDLPTKYEGARLTRSRTASGAASVFCMIPQASSGILGSSTSRPCS